MKQERIESDWKQAALSSGAHLRRIVEMYEELGFEVRLEEVSSEECGGCIVCYCDTGEEIYRIFTRPKQEVNSR